MPKHLADGLISGSWALARGVGEGITGLMTAPLEGAKKQGVKGMVKGFGQGIVGVVVKPIAGSFDFVTRTMEGGANTFDYALSKLDALMQDDADHGGGSALGESSEAVDSRMRPPRMMHGPERAIRLYSRSEANAHRVLSKLKDGIYCTEGLLLCVHVSASELLVLTEARLLRASTSSHTTTMHLPLAIIAHVGLRADGKAVQIWLKDGSRKPTHRGDGTVSGAARRGLESAKRWVSKHHLVRSSRPAQIASLSATALESDRQ